MTNEKKLSTSIAIALTLILGITAYFGFAAVQGDFGLLRRVELDAEKDALTRELAALNAEISIIRTQVRRLSDDNLDLDLLDQQARDILGLSRVDEVILR